MKFIKIISSLIFLSICVVLFAAPPERISNLINSENETTPAATNKTNAEVIADVFPQEAAAPEQTAETTSTNSTSEDSDFIAFPVSSPAVEEDASSTNEPDSNLITISVDDVSIEDVVRMFTRLSDANIIATPSNLSEKVTANLNGVEWKPALSTILSMHNLALVEKPTGSGLYKIVPRAANTPDPLVVETIFLEYTTVDEVTPVIQGMLPERGSLSAFTSRNALVIRSTADNIAEIKSVIKDIDVESKQICIEALFMELNDSAIKQLGIRWDSLAEFKIGAAAGPFTWKQDVEHNKSRADNLNYKDNRTSVDNLQQKFDEFGAPISGGDPVRTITDTIELGRNATSDIKDEFSKTITEKQAAILSVDTLQVVLSALKKTDGVSVVSNPKMIVANGSTNAFFRVGSREPIIKKTLETGDQNSPGDKYTSELDTGISTDYIKGGYLHTGIELKVVPTVKTDNLIEALIEPSLRRKTDEKVIYNADGQIENSWPIISVKEIKTRFTLESGQTVAIGGLTDTSNQKVVTKVPLLGDIPLLGKYLFSHTKDEKNQTETIIFVTLNIANPRNLDPNEAIPDHARLVKKRMIQDKIDKHNLDLELEELNRAADLEINGKPDDSEK